MVAVSILIGVDVVKRPSLILRLTLCGALAGSACQRYSAKPLDEHIIEQRSPCPPATQLQQEVDALHNPLMPSVDVDLEKGLTPASASAIAVAHNPTVHAQTDTLLGAQATLLTARILPNPQVTASADFPFGPKSAGNVIAYGVGLDWEITSLITHDAKIKSAQLGEEQIRLDIAWKQWQAAEGAKIALYDVVALREQLANARQLSDALVKVAYTARAALERHDMTAPDASAAESAADDAAVSVASTQRDLADAQLSLNQALGFPPDAQVPIDDTVALPTRIDPPAQAQLLDRLDKHRIDLVSLRRGYDSQDESLRAAIRGQFPKISLGLSNTRDYGNFLTLGPALTIDLPIFDRNQGNIAAARATRQQLYDEYIARVFEARADIVRAITLINALNEVVRLKDTEVQSLRHFVDVEQEALKTGNLDAATYYTAAVSLSQKQIELIKLRQDLLHAEITLEVAAGRAVFPIVHSRRNSRGKPMTNAIAQLLLFGGLLIAVAAGAFWLGHDFRKPPETATTGEAAAPESAATVETAHIRQGTITETVQAYGAMQPKTGSSISISVPFDARVLNVLATPGEQVKPETAVIEVGPTQDVDLQLRQAEDALAAANRNLEQVRRRLQEQLATNADVTAAETAQRSADAQVRSLKSKGIESDRQIPAGVTGIISQVNAQPGQVVPQGTAMLTIAPQSAFEAIIGVDPTIARTLKPGQSIALRPIHAGTEPAETTTSEIKRIADQINPQTHLIDVAIAPPADSGLLPGAFVTAEIPTRSSTGLIVPRSAIVLPEGKPVVFTVADGKAKEHTVTLGLTSADEVEIKADDLHAGDEVVTVGGLELNDGSEVKIENDAAATEAATESAATQEASPATKPEAP